MPSLVFLKNTPAVLHAQETATSLKIAVQGNVSLLRFLWQCNVLKNYTTEHKVDICNREDKCFALRGEIAHATYCTGYVNEPLR